MPLISLIIVLIVVGLLLWLVNTYLPMDEKIKRILNVVVLIVVVLWLLQVFGILDSINAVHVGRVGDSGRAAMIYAANNCARVGQ
jgi:hypothetical protein